jgi:hypothetical protein
MADEIPAANGQAQDPNAPQFAPQAVYVKDVSFEAPAGPRVSPTTANPTINLNLSTAVNDLGGDLKEVVLTVRVEAQAAEKTVWLVELQQAGDCWAFSARTTCCLMVARSCRICWSKAVSLLSCCHPSTSKPCSTRQLLADRRPPMPLLPW